MLSEKAAKRKTRAEGIKILKKTMIAVDFLNSIESFTPVIQNGAPSTELHAPSSPHTCHFMRLPPEIRIMIYELVFRRPRRLRLYKRVHHKVQRGPRLLLVSRALRNDAMPIYFKCNTFVVQADLKSYRAMGRWLGIIARQHGRTVTRNFQFQVLDHAWSNLEHVWRMIKLLAKAKIKLDTGEIRTELKPDRNGMAKDQSLFQMCMSERGYYMQVALEEAVLLGKRARRIDWSMGKLWNEFQALVAHHLSLANSSHRCRHKRTKNRNLREAEPDEIEVGE